MIEFWSVLGSLVTFSILIIWILPCYIYIYFHMLNLFPCSQDFDCSDSQRCIVNDDNKPMCIGKQTHSLLIYLTNCFIFVYITNEIFTQELSIDI